MASRAARRYATAATDFVTILIAIALVPRVTGWAFDWALPAARRRFTRTYTQEGHHRSLLNGAFHLGGASAEVCLVLLHALTYGAGVPIMYPLAGAALLFCAVDAKLKLRYVWPVPPRFDTQCTRLFLRIVQAALWVHLLVAAWQISYFRVFGQLGGAHSYAPSSSRVAHCWARGLVFGSKPRLSPIRILCGAP